MKIYILLMALVFNTFSSAEEKKYGVVKEKVDQSKINWVLDRHLIQESRGGTSNGLEPEIDIIPSEYFLELQKTESKKAKDRLAILSMTGEYRANFEFTELFGSNPNYELDNPYKSWGTETIIVIQNSENFISLQHILTMFMKNEDGDIKGPYVQKHWRQDWSFEDRKILEFQGNNEWFVQKKKDIQKSWSQAVYQVDDSPRYESYGSWVHEKGASKWISKITNRPLPRREHSVRKDYDLVQGINKISIMPWGWVMEENNDKIKIPKNFIGTEYGLARYQKVMNYDFNAAYKYWESTKGYWAIVRDKWDRILLSESKFCLKKQYKENPLFIYHFTQAEEYKNSKDIVASKNKIDETINNFIDYKCESK